MFMAAHPDDVDTNDNALAQINHYVLAHYSTLQFSKQYSKPNMFSLNAGLKQFGEQGELAIMTELTQFNLLNTFSPLDPATLSHAQWKTALMSLIFLTKKRDGFIKACAASTHCKRRNHLANSHK